MKTSEFKTSELLEISKNCIAGKGIEYCTNCCPFFKDDEDGYLCVNALLTALTDGFEMAHTDLAYIRSCHTCKYASNPISTNTRCTICFGGSHWQWRGEEQ